MTRDEKSYAYLDNRKEHLMANKKNVKKQPLPSSRSTNTPNRGAVTDPNPGERSKEEDALGTPLNSLDGRPARGNRAGGGQHIDTGARVGMMLNLEFAAGGRAHRLVTGTFSHNRPTYDPKSDRIHVSTASDSGDPSVGPPSNAGHQAMPEEVPGAGATNDTAHTTGPGRQRDKKTI